jgi:hypothetical protein
MIVLIVTIGEATEMRDRGHRDHVEANTVKTQARNARVRRPTASGWVEMVRPVRAQ